jgi:hypothetical protein
MADGVLLMYNQWLYFQQQPETEHAGGVADHRLVLLFMWFSL